MIRNLLLTLCVLMLTLALGVSAAEPIRIGTTQSLSGPLADFGTNQLRGLQMWVGDVNARGELLGREVELLNYDDGSSPTRSAELYRKLIEEDEVDLLVGPYSSDITLAAAPVAEQYGMPMLTLAASADEIWSQGYQYIVGLDTPSTRYMDLAVVAAAEQGARTMSLVYADTQFGRDVIGGIRSQALELGIEIVYEESGQTLADIPGIVRRLGAANADVVMAIAYLEGAVGVVREMKRVGLKPKMVAFGVGASLVEFGEQLGDDTEGMVGVVQWLRDIQLPGAQDFAYRFRTKYGVNPSPYAALGYSGGEVVEAAVRLAGTLDHAKVNEQLHTMVFNSLMGIYKVDANGRQVGKNNYLLQWQGKRRRLVAPDFLAETQLIYPLP